MSRKSFVQKRRESVVRLPLEGFLDLTYRCNNNCRHCWLYTPDIEKTARQELSFSEIREIVTQARAMGCRTWAISGGEAMLRDDFIDILHFIAENSMYYSLNTNGTRITPAIAKAMKKKGNKWVALYGATPEVHDHITRRSGSHDEALRGMALLKEAGANFTVHIVPMKDNYHQLQDMITLAESRNYDWRNGKAWFYLSAAGDPAKNREIAAQRLSAEQFFVLEDVEIPLCASLSAPTVQKHSAATGINLLASCISTRKDFHIDPYGRMSFCSMVKDPAYLYDLRKGTFAEAWEHFFPTLTDYVKGGEKYNQNCGSCNLRQNCSWCPLYSYLECGNYESKIPSLCTYAVHKKELQDLKEKNYQRFYQLAGLTIQVQAAEPITDKTFDGRFKKFEIDTPGEERILIKHHSGLPEMDWDHPGEPVYVHRPWAVYRKNDALIYCMDVSPEDKVISPARIAIVNNEHTRMNIYHRGPNAFSSGFSALTMFPTDVILLGQTLAHKQGFWLHSSAMIMNERGLLFVGPSGAGKSTMVKLLQEKAFTLCDERNIVRLWPEGFKVHGTWSHGELPTVNPHSAPLAGIFFIEQSNKNRAVRMTDKVTAHKKIMQCLVRPVQSSEWWSLTIDIVGKMLDEVPVFTLYFTQNGGVPDFLESLLRNDLHNSGGYQ